MIQTRPNTSKSVPNLGQLDSNLAAMGCMDGCFGFIGQCGAGDAINRSVSARVREQADSVKSLGDTIKASMEVK